MYFYKRHLHWAKIHALYGYTIRYGCRCNIEKRRRMRKIPIQTSFLDLATKYN